MAIQAAIAMLDIGVSSAVSRETTKYNAGVISYSYYKKTRNLFCYFFYCVFFIMLFVLFTNKLQITNSLFSSSSLSQSILLTVVTAIGINTALRWLTIYYRGILIGYEDMIWISYLNSVSGTLRYLGVFILYYGFDKSIEYYFIYQGCVILLEFVLLTLRVKKVTIPFKGATSSIEEQSVKALVKFALFSGASSFLWMGATVYDKITIATLISLAEYGYYTLAIIVASVINTINTPLKNIITPRLTSLYCTDKVEHRLFFIRSTMYAAIVFGSIAITVSIHAKELIYLWTSDMSIAINAQAYLSMYVLGNGLAIISSYVYYLQYSMGNLKKHVINIVAFLIIFVVFFKYFTSKYGAIGGGYAWLAANIFYFCTAYIIIVKSLLSQIWLSLFTRIIISLAGMLIIAKLFKANVLIDFYFGEISLIIINGFLCFSFTLLTAFAINYKIISKSSELKKKL